MSGSAWTAAVCVAAAVLLAAPSADRRLRRVLRTVAAPDALPRGRSGALPLAQSGALSRALPGVLATWAFRSRRRAPAVDGAAVVAELATLLRAGLPPARAWAALASSWTAPAAPAVSVRAPASHLSSVHASTAELPLGSPALPSPARFSAARFSSRHAADPLAGVLTAVAAEAASGGDVAGLLRASAPASPDAVTARLLSALSAAWEVAASTGAPTAAVLERLATTLREEADLRDARATAMAAPRASARVLVALPVVGLVLGQLVGAAPLAVLVGSGLGRACALAGGALSLAAWWWTRRLVLAAQRP